MTRRAEVLAARRDLLVARSAYLRADLQCESIAVGQSLRLVDRAVAFGQSAPGRALLAGGAVLLVLSGPRRVLRIVGRVLTFWPLVRPLVAALRSPASGIR